MKINWFFFSILAIIFLLIKFTLFSEFKIAGNTPDLLLAFSIYLAIKSDAFQAMTAGLILGLIKDSTTCEKFGMFTFIFFLTSFIIIKFKKEVLIDHYLVLILALLFFSFQCNFIHSIIIYFSYKIELFTNSIWCAFYTTISFPLVILLGNLSLVKVQRRKLR